MAKTYFNEQQIKKWFVSEQSAKKVYHDDKLVFSGGFELVIASSNHNVPANWIWSLLPADQQAAKGNTIIIKVNPGVELVTASTTINGVFDFSGSWAGKIVVIENSGIILGRGGNAGPYVNSNTNTSNGLPGGRLFITPMSYPLYPLTIRELLAEGGWRGWWAPFGLGELSPK